MILWLVAVGCLTDACQSKCRASRLLARLLTDDSVSPAHILLSPPQLRQLGVRPHRRLAVTLRAGQQPQSTPLAVVLHPVRELTPGIHRLISAEVDLQGLSSSKLRQFFASWLACQGAPTLHSSSVQTQSMPPATETQDAGVGARSGIADTESHTAGDGAIAQQLLEASAVPLQSGSMLSLQSADGERRSSFFVELSWPAAVLKDSQVMLQSAEAFLESSTQVELGPAIELPAASKADKSDWQEASSQSLINRHSADSGKQATDGTTSPPVSGGSRLPRELNGGKWGRPPYSSKFFFEVFCLLAGLAGKAEAAVLCLIPASPGGHSPVHLPLQAALAGGGCRSLARPRWRGCCRCCTTPAAACWPPWMGPPPGAFWSVGPPAVVQCLLLSHDQ